MCKMTILYIDSIYCSDYYNIFRGKLSHYSSDNTHQGDYGRKSSDQFTNIVLCGRKSADKGAKVQWNHPLKNNWEWKNSSTSSQSDTFGQLFISLVLLSIDGCAIPRGVCDEARTFTPGVWAPCSGKLGCDDKRKKKTTSSYQLIIVPNIRSKWHRWWYASLHINVVIWNIECSLQ